VSADAPAGPGGAGEGAPGADGYYGRPVLKRPAWTWEVPWYLWTGGLAGASSVLSVAARAAGNRPLARAAAIAAAPAAAVSPALLVSDLGRPERFLNMLRVFRPSSPLSMGAWLLSAYAPLAVGAGAAELLGILPRVRTAAAVGAAALGPGLVTYTAVLLAHNAVPVWHGAQRELPFVFAGSAAASAGGAAFLLAPAAAAEPARRVAIAGGLLELAAERAMERRLGPLAAPYEGDGPAARLARRARGLTAAGTALAAAGGGRRRPLAAAGAALLLAGSACQRWAVYRAGFASAADPRATIAPQRARLDAGDPARA